MKAAFLFLPVFLFQLNLGELPVSVPGPGPGKKSKELNRTVMLQLVNKVRANGCNCGGKYYAPAPPLAWNGQLEKAAFEHSQDMWRKNYFSHKAPDGSNGGNRIERAGYNWKAYGENIAFGYTSEREVVKGWLSSPGHCKNIMNRNYREMGVSRVANYWTQTFGTR